MEDGIRRAAEHVRARIDRYTPDPDKHALLDRIAEEQEALGA
jgi:hypothetical protein